LPPLCGRAEEEKLCIFGKQNLNKCGLIPFQGDKDKNDNKITDK
jgi:hypothetical protein